MSTSRRILFREIAGYHETSDNIVFGVTEEQIRETLFRTGLLAVALGIGWVGLTKHLQNF